MFILYIVLEFYFMKSDYKFMELNFDDEAYIEYHKEKMEIEKFR